MKKTLKELIAPIIFVGGILLLMEDFKPIEKIRDVDYANQYAVIPKKIDMIEYAITHPNRW